MALISKRGWLAIRFRHRGTLCEEYLGLPDNRDNRREAQRKLAAVRAEIRAGRFDYASHFPNSARLARLGLPPRADQTLGDFALAWLEEHCALSPATLYDYRLLLRTHVLPHPIAQKPLAAMDDGDIQRLIAQIAEKQTTRGPLSARRVNMVIARLRSIFATARRRKLIPDNPMLYVRNLREAKPEVDPFELAEARRIIEAAQGWERAFVSVLIFTGMRPNEALALKWDAIDWERNLIFVRSNLSRVGGRVRFGLPKTAGSAREVEMIPFVRERLHEQRARSQLSGDLVFPAAHGGPIDLANFRRRNWPRILARAKVRPRVLYQCRHTFARLAIEAGDTPQHVAAMLGHATVEMVFRVYGRWLNRPQSAALEALQQAIESVANSYRATDSIPPLSHSFGGKPAGTSGKVRERLPAIGRKDERAHNQ